MIDWIDVNDKLPKKTTFVNSPVLVYTKDGEIQTGLFCGNHVWADFYDERNLKVTHWMHLPKRPNND